MSPQSLEQLMTLLRRIPAIKDAISELKPDSMWWIKLNIDIDSPIAWNVVQEFAFVLNYISVTERLPTIFKPVSPPPFLNGGPKEYLSWVIESTELDVDPSWIAGVPEGRLPTPVDDLERWLTDIDN